jgi:hypothetical protein
MCVPFTTRRHSAATSSAEAPSSLLPLSVRIERGIPEGRQTHALRNVG